MRSDLVLLVVRLVLGIIMVHYGWPKIRNLARNAKDFEAKGFAPGLLWGTAVAFVEVVGGLVVLAGVYPEIAAALFAFEMLVGTVWKLKKRKSFADYSYDIQLLALCLVLAGIGSDSYVIVSLGPVLFLNWSVVFAAVTAALVLVYLPGIVGLRSERLRTASHH